MKSFDVSISFSKPTIDKNLLTFPSELFPKRKRRLLHRIFIRLYESGLFRRLSEAWIAKVKPEQPEAAYEPARLMQVNCTTERSNHESW